LPLASLILKNPEQMPVRTLNHSDRVLAEAIVIAYVATIAAISLHSAIPYLFFPELGALAYDILMRPWGKWASQPILLFVTPTITAAIGTVVTRRAPFNGLSVIVIVALSVLVIAGLKSTIAPSMSAGVLPLVLGVKSWLYPLAILMTMATLSVISVIWRKYHATQIEKDDTAQDIDDVLESPPRGRFWILLLLIFSGVVAEIARVSGLRFILFPPIITIAYEMFGHPETCPWTKRPISLPLSCFLAALCGLLAFYATGIGVILTICGTVSGILLLRVFDLHMPPVMAVALLPEVMNSPNWRYPVAVFLGTIMLTLTFLWYRRARQKVSKSRDGAFDGIGATAVGSRQKRE
jgi:hypothetical protein